MITKYLQTTQFFLPKIRKSSVDSNATTSNDSRSQATSVQGLSRTASYVSVSGGSTNRLPGPSETRAIPKWRRMAGGIGWSGKTKWSLNLLKPLKILRGALRKKAPDQPEAQDRASILRTYPFQFQVYEDLSADANLEADARSLSPTPSSLIRNHTYEDAEGRVPIFSGWAAFCGTHIPPRVVRPNHWDEVVSARQAQARAEADYDDDGRSAIERQYSSGGTGSAQSGPETSFASLALGPGACPPGDGRRFDSDQQDGDSGVADEIAPEAR